MICGISIIVCTYNGMRTISLALKSILEQVNIGHINWELIIVNNNSTDGTVDIVKKFILSSQHPQNIKLVTEKQQGLLYARIRGYKEAKYNIISFIDDDNYVENKWIYKVYNIMLKDEAIGACGGQGLLCNKKSINPSLWFSEFQDAYAVGKQSESTGYVTHLWGAGLTIRKEILDVMFGNNYEMLLSGRIGQSLMSGEDSELSYGAQILGYKLYYDEKLTYYHDIDKSRMTLEYLEKLFKGFGKSNVYLRAYMKQVLKYQNSKTLNFSNKWYIVYLYNFAKNIYYSIKKSVSSNKLRYEMQITFNSEFNKELLKNRARYKKLFIHVEKLNGYKRAAHGN